MSHLLVHFMAIVTVFISWRLNFYGVEGLILRQFPLWAFTLFPCWDASGCISCRGHCFLGLFFEVLTSTLQTPSHLLHASVILRDQVCPSTNKGGCFVTHPLFVVYKPDPLDHTAHLNPPPSLSIAMSIFVQ